MPENEKLKYITTCTLCSQRFSNSALPVIGETPDANTRHFVEGLIFHLRRNHAPQFAEFTRNMILMSNKFAAWLALQSFQTADPNLLRSQEELRSWVHGLTRKNQLSDAEITDKLVGAEPLTLESALAVCKEIRDFMGERGAYNPTESRQV